MLYCMYKLFHFMLSIQILLRKYDDFLIAKDCCTTLKGDLSSCFCYSDDLIFISNNIRYLYETEQDLLVTAKIFYTL